MTSRGPLQIIADQLPEGPNVWIGDRLLMAHDILIALNEEGYVIHAARCPRTHAKLGATNEPGTP